jgi:DNA-binding response OmpR family regulator
MKGSTPFAPKILVAGCDLREQQVLESTMRLMGAKPQCVHNHQDAARLVERKKIDGAFVDWDDTNLNGRELTRKIRSSKSNSHVPVAMISRGKNTMTVKEAFTLGVTFFLPKPFTTSEIAHLINAMRGSMLEERRRYQRVAVSVSLLCVWGPTSRERQKQAKGQSINISSTGLLMRLHPQPEMGTVISMEFLLPDAHEILKVKGVVKRVSSGQGVGVEFVGVSQSEQRVLEAFITSQPASGLFLEA